MIPSFPPHSFSLLSLFFLPSFSLLSFSSISFLHFWVCINMGHSQVKLWKLEGEWESFQLQLDSISNVSFSLSLLSFSSSLFSKGWKFEGEKNSDFLLSCLICNVPGMIIVVKREREGEREMKRERRKDENTPQIRTIYAVREKRKRGERLKNDSRFRGRTNLLRWGWIETERERERKEES